MLLVLSPLPGLVLLEQVVQRLCNVGKVQDPSAIEIDETDELAHAAD